MKREFKIIAAGLGIILPASLSGLGEAQASNLVDLSQSTILKNDVSKRIFDFQVKDFAGEEDNTIFAHTNYHTDSAPHTNSHSNKNHVNKHTNRDQPNMCPSHSDIHTNSEGYDDHTDRASTHANKHTNREDKC